jgi:hypothetical protein
MQRLLEICEGWSREVGMEFAPSKCELLDNPNNANTILKLYGEELKKSKDIKYLGIYYNYMGINKDATIRSQCDKTRGVVAGLAKSGFSLNGLTVEANLRVFKTFVRPLYEYGLQIQEFSRGSTERLQKAQNQALRTLLGAPRNASILAMHKLAHIPLIHHRAEELNGRFKGNLLKRADERILATRYVREEATNTISGDNQSITTGTTNTNWATLSRKERLKEHQRRLRDDPGNLNGSVAATLELQPGAPLRYFLKQNCPRRIRSALTRWAFGGVAWHQSCKHCGSALSRRHAVMCSGAEAYILQHFNAVSPPDARTTVIDVLLNRYISDTEGTALAHQHLAEAIHMIYRHCFKYRNAGNGLWVPETQDGPRSTPDHRAYSRNSEPARKRRRTAKQPTVDVRSAGRPRGRNR